VLNHPDSLDRVFRALADRTRRAVVERLVGGPASVGDLAAPLDMSLSAVMQHLQVLVDAGLAATEKTGRVRVCRIRPDALRTAESWLGRQRTEWEHRLDRLDRVVADDETTAPGGHPMTDRSVIHSSFEIERTYPVPTARVFAAWADPAVKARWFAAGGSHELDFRVGGREVNRTRRDDGVVLTFASEYRDIVEGERIVYTSTLCTDDTPATVSLTTVQFRSTGDGTELVLVEQDSFLDGHEHPSWRERGTDGWLTALGEELQRPSR
jgi:uncharacterized protein YndB with AHSA1/START domain/DNA-binding transcriptional ArsR family regulator